MKVYLVAVILFISVSAFSGIVGWKWNELSQPNEVSQKGDVVSFDVHPNPAKGIRQELVYSEKALPKSARQFEVWFRLSQKTLAQSQSGDLESITLARWNENIAAGGKRPPLSFRFRQGHLVATVWNEKLYERNPDSDGLIAIDRALKADLWYRVSGCIEFSPEQGRMKLEVQSCGVVGDCSAAPVEAQYKGQPGLGFRDSVDYALRMGVYSSGPAKSAVAVDERIVNDQVLVVSHCEP